MMSMSRCWEVMLCDSCGSQGTHLACSGLMTPMDDWNCDVVVVVVFLVVDMMSMSRCWEVMLCDSCGSQGTHLACSGLMTPMDDWNCEACTLILRRSQSFILS